LLPGDKANCGRGRGHKPQKGITKKKKKSNVGWAGEKAGKIVFA